MKNLYAVVKVSTKTINSKWFMLENGELKDVTFKLFSDVSNYNETQSNFNKIPYSFKDGFIKYSFGCGLTHYLQNDNLKSVTDLDVDNIIVFTTNDFTMYDIKKSYSDWKKALETMLAIRG